MGAQVVDAVAVMHGAVRFQGILGAQTVLHHHDRDAVTIVDLVEGVAQALGIDLPAPVGSLQVRVLEALRHVAVGLGGILVGGDAVGHIVAQGIEIHSAVLQNLGITGLHVDGHAHILPQTLGKSGIFATHLYVRAVPEGVRDPTPIVLHAGGFRQITCWRARRGRAPRSVQRQRPTR